MATYKKNTLHVESVSLDRVAAEVGTPAYVYSAGKIRDNYNAYDKAFQKVLGKGRYTICYAVKACSNIGVLALLNNLGAGADIVSGGEMERASVAGIPFSKIVYSGIGKNDAELAAAIKSGLMQINVESEEELGRISKIATKLKKTAHIALRINPDVDAKTHAKITTGRKENKFGIDIVDAPALYKKAQKMPGIIADGVAVHIGSQLTAMAPFKRAYTKIAKLVATLNKQGNQITRIDIGGGIGIQYKEEVTLDLSLYALMVRDCFEDLDVHIVMEPGRSIVGNAGILLSSVMQVKPARQKTFMILDAAMNDLMRPALYDAYHAILPVKKAAARYSYDIVGPVCETGDTFLKNEKMPKLVAGDLVAIMTSGAYGAVMSSNYNTRPLLPEVMVDGDRIDILRPRQKVSEILAGEKVPSRFR